ncbi:MAG: uridine kinase [Planctomycetes bacterium]|nr:uridine kinase [Planctomycetota bacterium]
MSPGKRTQINYDHPDALESSLLIEHIKSLCKGKVVQIPVYDFVTHTRIPDVRKVGPVPIIILEGILILFEEDLRSFMDIKVYVDTDADIRPIRRMERDIIDRRRTRESVMKQYLETIHPMHLEFVEPSKRYADIIVPEGGHNQVAVDILATKLRSLVHLDKPYMLEE